METTEKNVIWQNGLIKWIDLTNPTKEELKVYAEEYKIDNYTLTDCLEPNHLPKEEKSSNIDFIILRIYDQKVKNFPSSIQEMSNKIAIFYTDSFLLTIHRNPSPVMQEIIRRYLDTDTIHEISEIVTKIMWFVVKSYQDVAISLAEEIDRMEKLIFIGTQSQITLRELYYLKNSSRLNKKVLNLTKEVVIEHTTTKKDRSALQDVKDLLQKLTLSFEETYEDSNSLSNIYLSLVSQKTNNVMKLLTIFSVFFMPLTFIVGVYGMNFEFMPELHWKYGYPLIMSIMAFIGILLFIWFKRKKVL